MKIKLKDLPWDFWLFIFFIPGFVWLAYYTEEWFLLFLAGVAAGAWLSLLLMMCLATEKQYNVLRGRE